MDGYPIHSAYSDGESASADLDECNGHATDELGYHYHANPAEQNGVLTCFMGLTVGGGQGGRGGRGGGQGGPPDGGPPEGDAAPNENGNAARAFVEPQFYGDYEITNDEFGTNVTVMVTDNERIMFTNSIPPWPADDFPVGNNTDISEQARTYNLPLNPVYVGNATRERSTGVSVTGIKFDAGTAQRAQCENGVQYNVEAVNDLIPFGIDAHNAHVQNDGTYHYHNVPVSEISGTELQHVGFALDGFLIYYSPTSGYPSSYQLRIEDREGINCTYSEPDLAEITFDSTPDGTFQQDYEYIEGLGVLDECNGTMINGMYAYFVTDEYPHVPRCLNGEVPGNDGGGVQPGGGGQGGPGGGQGGPGGGQGGGQGGGPGGGQGGPGGGQGGPGGGPGRGGVNFGVAAEILGITEQALRNAVGGPPPDVAAAAEILGISEEEIQAAIDGDAPPPEGNSADNDGAETTDGNRLTDGPPIPGEFGPLSASDANRDGTVTRAEIESFMEQGPYRRTGLVDFFDLMDIDADGVLSSAEFAIVDPPYAFDGTDADADGVVTRTEVENYVENRLYRRIGLGAFFELVNTDGNDELSPEEIQASLDSGLLTLD